VPQTNLNFVCVLFDIIVEQLLMKIRGIVNNNKQQKHVAFYSVVYAYMYNFLTYQIFTLGRFCLGRIGRQNWKSLIFSRD
jgi:hypothetical protein